MNWKSDKKGHHFNSLNHPKFNSSIDSLSNHHTQSSSIQNQNHLQPPPQKFESGKLYQFNKNITKIIPKESGHYEFIWKFPGNNELIYVGVADKKKYGNLHHRVESYLETDDFKSDGNPSKKELRIFIKNHPGQIFIKVFVEPIEVARRKEKQLKQQTRFNQDNPRNKDTFHYTE